jgi:branched-chain amino acid transport system ATP-binding protein
MPLLEIDGLTGGWGPTTIVEDFSLSVDVGEVVSIIGRNGVGKTTTLELIMGRARRRGGTIRLAGSFIETLPTFERCRLGLGFVPQGREIFPNLTVVENLSAAARAGVWTMDRVMDLFPSLRRRAKNLGRQLSGGELQMLAIARALMGNPKVLLLDEPTEGLAPIIVDQLIEVIGTLTRSKELGVVLIEQIIDVAFDLSDRCVVMDRGHIVKAATSAELRADEGLIRELMGLDDGLQQADTDSNR